MEIFRCDLYNVTVADLNSTPLCRFGVFVRSRLHHYDGRVITGIEENTKTKPHESCSSDRS